MQQQAQPQANWKPRIRPLGNGRYLVESATKHGVGHVVDASTGQCSCPAGRYNRPCWHRGFAANAHHFYVQAEADRQARAHAAAGYAPSVVPFHETAGYKALAECFA